MAKRLVLAVLLSLTVPACGSDEGSDSQSRGAALAQALQRQEAKREQGKSVALKLLARSESAKSIAAANPDGSWSVTGDYDQGADTYCPDEYDVRYTSTVDSEKWWQWHTNVAVSRISSEPETSATVKAAQEASLERALSGSDLEDRIPLCWDGKPPVLDVQDPNADNNGPNQ